MKSEYEVIKTLSGLKFTPIVFDNGKYEDHVEAIKNKDFIKLDLSFDYNENVSYFQHVYYNAKSVFESLKGILKSDSYKFALPYYHLDLNSTNLLYEMLEYTEYEEEESFFELMIEILEEDYFLIKHADNVIDSKKDFLLDFEKVIIEDLKGNLKINNKSLFNIVEIIKSYGISLEDIKKEIIRDKYSKF